VYRLYDFECPSCGATREELIDVPPMAASVHCTKCGALMRYVVIGGKSYTFKPFWHPHLGHEPVYITGWRQYRRELSARGLENPLAS